jgi:hypothetical protein
MDRRRDERFCRSCASRLARDNPASHCTPCRSRARDWFVAPPVVPVDFWEAEPLRAAFDAWHMGQVVRAYRHHPLHGHRPLSQELVANWLGLTQTQLSRLESGPPITDLDRLISWARILGIPSHLLWFKLPEDRRSAAETRRPPDPPAAPSLPSWVPMSLPPLTGAVPGVGGDYDMATMQSFRAADRQVGGGHLYATVLSYLQTSLAPRLFGGQDASEGNSVFTVAGGFTEMAGWMAHDAGHDVRAKQHFRRSLDLSQMGGDRQLRAHVYASLSHLYLHLDEPRQAIKFAQQGHTALAKRPPAPSLSARLLAMEARGLAALDEATACARQLLKAERTLQQSEADEPSPWVGPFDAGSLASEAARCLHQLGQLDEAERHARRVIQLRAGSHIRSRAFGQLLLVSILIARGELEEACTLAFDVLHATQALSSHVVTRQLQELHTLLEPYRGNQDVDGFLPGLRAAVSQRLGLYGWLASSTAGQ